MGDSAGCLCRAKKESTGKRRPKKQGDPPGLRAAVPRKRPPLPPASVLEGSLAAVAGQAHALEIAFCIGPAAPPRDFVVNLRRRPIAALGLTQWITHEDIQPQPAPPPMMEPGAALRRRPGAAGWTCRQPWIAATASQPCITATAERPPPPSLSRRQPPRRSGSAARR